MECMCRFMESVVVATNIDLPGTMRVGSVCQCLQATCLSFFLT